MSRYAGRAARAALCAVVWASPLLLASCDRVPEPIAPVGPQLGLQQNVVSSGAYQPFYYYFGQPQYLTVEPTQLIVET